MATKKGTKHSRVSYMGIPAYARTGVMRILRFHKEKGLAFEPGTRATPQKAWALLQEYWELEKKLKMKKTSRAGVAHG